MTDPDSSGTAVEIYQKRCSNSDDSIRIGITFNILYAEFFVRMTLSLDNMFDILKDATQ